MPLETYRAKRNFGQTPEPAGQLRTTGRQRFVVQEHHASRLHYDFRLEMGGVLKSWAVPKGPSLNPRDRRLAVQVEDHPVDYLDFEGHIEEGNYGAGDVYVWDTGTYSMADDAEPLRALESGRLKFSLAGGKLAGEFNLVRMQDQPDQWLLIKARDELADSAWRLEQVHKDDSEPSASQKRPRNTATKAAGRSAAPKKPASSSGARAAKTSKTRRKRASTRTTANDEGEPAPFPGFITPMLATLVDRPFDDEDWLFETKWDGVRALTYLEDGQVRLLSRNEKDMSARYPELAALPQAVRARQAVLDGEIVALDEAGRSSFQRLQSRVGLQDQAEIARLAHSQPVTYQVFDLLYLDGRDLRGLPLVARQARLAAVTREGPRVRLPSHVVGSGVAAFTEAQRQGLEGLVAKRLASPYRAGRAGDWLKLKTLRRQEVVIGGYTDPRRTRPYLGALVVGLFQGAELIYVGHVGGGFNHAALQQVHALLQPLRTGRAPFSEPPPTNEAVHWVQPQLVAEVKFSEWTADRRLRQPIFLGLRDDKNPRQCVFEREQSTSTQVAAAERGGANEAGAEAAVKKTDSKAAHSRPNSRAASEPAKAVFTRRNLSGDRRVRARSQVVELTSLDRVYWPAEGLTKGDLLRYEWQVAEHKLPYLANRPLILKRYPNGIDSTSFFQHDVNDVPGYVRTVRLETETGREVDYVVATNLATLLYLGNLGAIAQNPWHSRLNNLDRPDWMVLDLDPSEGVRFESLCELALTLHEALDRLGLLAYPKTSGSRGLHVYVPLRAIHPYAEVAAFAERLAQRVAAENPSLATLERSLKARPPGTIYLDHLQNARGKSIAAPYSVRARPGATVSAPLTWQEVKRCVDPHDFTLKTMPRRLSRLGDLFAPVRQNKQSLSRALQSLGA